MENDQYKLESKKLNETVISLENYISDLKNQMEPPSWLRYDSFTNKDEIDFLLSERDIYIRTKEHIQKTIDLYENQLAEVYYARIDINYRYRVESHYISRLGIKEIGTVDWRTDIGALLNDVTTNAYNGGTVTLKRKFKIAYNDLKFYSDTVYENSTDNNLTDGFLIYVLKEKKGQSRITNIIASIQAKQNQIIRLPIDYNFVVMGCAGSGKTMIMLHRLSYLKYNSNLNWKRVKIIAPNSTFNEVFSNLKKELEIEQAEMMTISEYYQYKLKIRNYSFYLCKTLDENSLIDHESLVEIYSAQTQSYLFTSFLTIVNELFEIFLSFEGNEKYSTVSIEKDKYSILEKSENIFWGQSHELYRKFDHFYRENELQILNIKSLTNEFFTYKRIIADFPAYKKLDSMMNSIVEDRHHFLYDKFDLLDIYDAKNRIELFFTRLQMLDNQKKEIELLINNYKMEFGKIVSNKQLAEAERDKHMTKVTIIKESIKGLKFFRLIKKWKYSKELREENRILESYDTKINSFALNMQELEGKISESKKSKLKIERELNDSELIASYKSALRIRTELEPHFALISQILKSLDDISKISEAIDKMQSINDIKRWYEKEFIDRYINKLLESKNSPIINNINKYNFYYYYLLLFLSTYSNEYNKENSDTLICIDECQDLSINELRLVEEVNPEASINLFGDINQRLTPKGASSLEDYPSNYTSYMLKNNYRNTYEITSFYNKNLIMDDIPVGVNGPEVLNCSLGDLSESFQNANSVFICTKKEYSFLVKMKIPIKVMIIEDAKGLEFHTVCVYDKNMTKNEKYIAYSRALYQLIRITSLNVERE